MNGLVGNVLGLNVGQVLSTGVAAAGNAFQSFTSLRIAQENLRAQQLADQRAAQTQRSSDNNIRLLVTGGLVLGGVVLSIRALRR